MELFKVCEKDTKTKTYSKEGLARAAKLDPEEQKKVDCNSWVLEMVDVMMQKVDEVRMARKYSEGGGALSILAAKSDRLIVVPSQHEAEIDQLSAGKGKKNNRKAIESWNQHITNHKYHIDKVRHAPMPALFSPRIASHLPPFSSAPTSCLPSSKPSPG
jgi:CCR4-NOT transcription complex subunit 3